MIGSQDGPAGQFDDLAAGPVTMVAAPAPAERPDWKLATGSGAALLVVAGLFV